MNKKIGIVLLVIVAGVLAFIAYQKFKKSEAGTLDDESRNFSYKDTASITRIFIADKAGRTADLVRKDGEWIVNGKFPARKDAVISVLKCLKYLEVKHPVSEKARPHVIKELASTAVKAEFYSGDDAVKIFYVGGETQDHTGTYMLLVDPETGENYERPYVMGLPGFEGYLTPRFFVAENDWKDTKVLDFTPPQINEVILEIPDQPDSSFMIRLHDTKTFELLDLKGKPQSIQPDVNAMKQYVAYLQNLHYEKLLDPSTDKTADSIRRSRPFAILSINDKKGKQHQYLFYHKKIGEGQKQKYGIEAKFDPDRCYMEFDDRKSMAMVQFYVFGKLLQTKSYFYQKSRNAMLK